MSYERSWLTTKQPCVLRLSIPVGQLYTDDSQRTQTKDNGRKPRKPINRGIHSRSCITRKYKGVLKSKEAFSRSSGLSKEVIKRPIGKYAPNYEALRVLPLLCKCHIIDYFPSITHSQKYIMKLFIILFVIFLHFFVNIDRFYKFKFYLYINMFKIDLKRDIFIFIYLFLQQNNCVRVRILFLLKLD